MSRPRVAALTEAQTRRFWTKVRVGGSDECWEFQGAKKRGGYGSFWGGGAVEGVEPSPLGAHRVAWYLKYGYWPRVCRHRCDNPPCCNPGHLRDGTDADNTQDMLAKGRNSFRTFPGDAHWNAKLTEADVRAMRARYAEGGITFSDLGREYGVGKANARHVVRRLSWKHVA